MLRNLPGSKPKIHPPIMAYSAFANWQLEIGNWQCLPSIDPEICNTGGIE